MEHATLSCLMYFFFPQFFLLAFVWFWSVSVLYSAKTCIKKNNKKSFWRKAGTWCFWHRNCISETAICASIMISCSQTSLEHPFHFLEFISSLVITSDYLGILDTTFISPYPCTICNYEIGLMKSCFGHVKTIPRINLVQHRTCWSVICWWTSVLHCEISMQYHITFGIPLPKNANDVLFQTQS